MFNCGKYQPHAKAKKPYFSLIFVIGLSLTGMEIFDKTLLPILILQGGHGQYPIPIPILPDGQGQYPIPIPKLPEGQGQYPIPIPIPGLGSIPQYQYQVLLTAGPFSFK